MILVGHAQRGEAPGVFQIGIEGAAVVFDGKRCAMAKNLHGAREIVAQNILEALAPSRRAWRKAAQGEADGRHIETGVETAAAVETDFVGIEFVKIVENAADCETFVVVERMFEYAHGHGAAVEHEMLADFAAAVSEAVGKLCIGGEEKEAR